AWHGILGAGGAAAMVLGAALLVHSPLPELRVRLSVAIALPVPFALLTTLLLTLVIRARAGKVITGSAAMIGEEGVAITQLAPEGKVQVHGEYLNAVVWNGTPVEPG